MRPQGHDDLGAGLIGHEHGDVLAGAGGGEDVVLDPELLDMGQARGAPVAVGVNDDLGTAGECLVGHGVHVAHDHGRFEACVQDGVGASVDTDDDGLVLADVGPERLQVLLVGVTAHDHQDVLATHLRGQ